MTATIIASLPTQQRTLRLRHRPRTFCEKPGKVKRLSEEKAHSRPDQQAQVDALAALSGGAWPGESDAIGSPDGAQAAMADDVMLAPPPDQFMLARARASRASPVDRAIERRRTLIPSLLTLGMLLPIVASLKWLGGADSIFSVWSSITSIALAAVGICLLGIGIVTMRQVNHLRQGRQHAVREV